MYENEQSLRVVQLTANRIIYSKRKKKEEEK